MNKKVALIGMFFILGAVLVFHFLIFREQIPYDKVWAGKLNSVEEMKAFEAFSILINVFMMVVLFIKYHQVKRGKRNKVVDAFIWIFVGFFALNTFGNLFAKSMIELIFGTLLTLISSILCFVIAKKEQTKEQSV